MIGPFNTPYRWLSNFWPVQITYGEGIDRITYPTVEHAFQAQKTLDINQRLSICQCPTAGEAKRAGRKLVLRPDWEQVKIDVMRDLLRLKFDFDQLMLRSKLVATGDETLVEINNWGDTFWGVCRGEGTNQLGKLLMEVRVEIQKGAQQ